MKIYKKIIKILKRPKIIIIFFQYKILSIFAQKTLNKGERYDPLIGQKIKINAPMHKPRYLFAANLIKPKDTVLDLACGTGYGTNILSKNSLKITGVDVSKNAINYANKHYRLPNNEFIISDLFEINKKADIVVSFETVEHISAPFQDILKKLISLANNKLVISTPYKEAPGRNKHHRHFNIDQKKFDILNEYGQIDILFQNSKGEIINTDNDCKNIIVVLTKTIKTALLS